MEQASVPVGVEAQTAEQSMPVGVHLVGSVPLGSAEEVFRLASQALGDRLRRIPDGETGPRADWILWQYPVFSSRPQFEVGPPGPASYRTLPQLRLRAGAHAEDVSFDELGFAASALASYRLFARLKRDGHVPPGCRFQLSLPTPLAPVSAFVAPEDQAGIEPAYEARMLEEVTRILEHIPADQLAIQWDARFEFAMLEGIFPTWFADVRGGVLERLLRLGRHVPPATELGYHLCYGDEAHGHFVEPEDAGKLVTVANALATSLDRSLDWIHMPVPRDRVDDAWFAPLGSLELQPETELYLGLLHHDDGIEGARPRIAAAGRHVEGFGVATDCGWGRGGSEVVDDLLDLHRALSQPTSATAATSAGFEWPAGFVPIPDEDWTGEAVDESGLAYDRVERHGWYANLDSTVEELAVNLRDGDLLLDYSGGTGILLDRLRLRIFDRQIGALIVDASAKFLRVALEKYRDDPRVGLRLLRFVKEEKRLESLGEVLGPEMLEHGVDAIVCANAIHLYPDLSETLSAWARTLRPDGKVFVNSGNLRNPRAAASEWIIDETVGVINDLAEGLVRSDSRYEQYREVLDDPDRMSAHASFRHRVFLEPRPLEHYVEVLEGAGLEVLGVREETIEASVQEWFEFLSAYHEAVLGWVGGTKKVEGEPADQEAIDDRLAIMRHAMDTLFGGRPNFDACWTYITCGKRG